MIRVIYLLQIADLAERQRLIQSTLRGERWKVSTQKGKFRSVTDREMVAISQQRQGWTQSVYKFGCAFIHLSDFHNHLTEDPFHRLALGERQDILVHMRSYHGGPTRDNPDMNEIAEYLPRVFDKIADNLGCYLREIEENSVAKQ